MYLYVAAGSQKPTWAGQEISCVKVIKNLLVIPVASIEKLEPCLPKENKQGQGTGMGFQHGPTIILPSHCQA